MTKTLRIFGKGKGNQSEIISLGIGTVTAIESWLSARGEHDPDKSLFVSINPGYRDGRLSTQSIYDIVKSRCQDAGITKTMSPHRVHHGAITRCVRSYRGGC